MFNRGIVFSLLLLVVCGNCFSDEDWSVRFEKERAQALKHAGPSRNRGRAHGPKKEVAVIAIKAPIAFEEKHQDQPAAPQKKTKRKLVFHEPRVKPQRSSHRQVEEIVGKASRARENGQLEHALRLYKLAHSMEPKSSEVVEKIKEVEREMN